MLLAIQQELNDVLWECLNVCSDANRPEQALESFVKGLRSNRQWSRSEIDELESTARRLVSGVDSRR